MELEIIDRTKHSMRFLEISRIFTVLENSKRWILRIFCLKTGDLLYLDCGEMLLLNPM